MSSRPPLVVLLVLSLVAGCSSSSAPSGDGGSDAGPYPPPVVKPVTAECAAAASGAGPYAVSFHLVNSGTSPVSVALVESDCPAVVTVSACVDGYAGALMISSWDPLGPVGSCEAGCMLASSGGCGGGATSLEPGADHEAYSWDGSVYAFYDLGQCSCASRSAMPAAKYRASVAVSSEVPDGGGAAETWTATVDFELPAPGGVVDIPVAKPK